MAETEGDPARTEEARTVVRALCLSAQDSVAVLLADADSGDVVRIADQEVVAMDAVPAGHKVAITIIHAGDRVVKYGESIGVAVVSIKPGEHVHTRNLRSARATAQR